MNVELLSKSLNKVLFLGIKQKYHQPVSRESKFIRRVATLRIYCLFVRGDIKNNETRNRACLLAEDYGYVLLRFILGVDFDS